MALDRKNRGAVIGFVMFNPFFAPRSAEQRQNHHETSNSTSVCDTGAPFSVKQLGNDLPALFKMMVYPGYNYSPKK